MGEMPSMPNLANDTTSTTTEKTSTAIRVDSSGSKARDSIASQLRAAARDQYPVQIWREHEWGADSVYGFVVDVSPRWVAVQCLADSVYFDGYQLLRVEDVIDVVDDRENGFIERGIASLGRPEVDFHLPDVANTAEVLRAATDHSELVGIDMEKRDQFFVGVVTTLGERKFDMHLIGADGAWLHDPGRWWYGDVTRVMFGDRYTHQLKRFGESRPGT